MTTEEDYQKLQKATAAKLRLLHELKGNINNYFEAVACESSYPEANPIDRLEEIEDTLRRLKYIHSLEKEDREDGSIKKMPFTLKVMNDSGCVVDTLEIPDHENRFVGKEVDFGGIEKDLEFEVSAYHDSFTVRSKSGLFNFAVEVGRE